MEYKILKNIKSPQQVKQLNKEEIGILCNEVRDCLINTVSKNGGHLASNLGVVELTVAIHRVFNSPEDAIIFDVGHQSYTHKLLTGRYEEFSTLRTEGGISGFMRPKESNHDAFVTGHASNSVSAAYGIYKAKCISGESGTAVAVIGDGALSGGMAFEGLNNAGSGHGNFIVILNDNKMSISRNVGSLARYLTVIRTSARYHRFKYLANKALLKIPFIGKKISDKLLVSKRALKNALYHANVFESLGFNYFGPVDGHNVAKVEKLLTIAKHQSKPALIHVVTTKGKGYSFAEKNPKNFHGVSGFDVENGLSDNKRVTFSDIAGDALCEIANLDKNVCAITAAMTQGTSLTAFSKQFTNRFFDVGIAEEHAVTFAAGLAKGGMKPYFAVYSSFLQRAYDQIIHDTAIMKLPVRFCIDRAGIVGEDGETHQGLFDVSFLTGIPNMTVYSPASFNELHNCLINSLGFSSPVAIRYPRGSEGENSKFDCFNEDYTVFFGGGKTAIITYGRLSAAADAAAINCDGCDFIKLNKIYPLPDGLVDKLMKYKSVCFFEEAVQNGSISEHLASELLSSGYKGKYKAVAVKNKFVGIATVNDALKNCGLDYDNMVKTIREIS